MTEEKKDTQEKKGFFKKIFEKIDKALKEKAASGCGCCGSSKPGDDGNSCCK